MNRGHVVHVVRSDSYSGVERYVVTTAGELVGRGWQVTVIGGDPARMRNELPAAVRFRAAATVAEVARELWSLRRVDVVHAHMTAAELPCALLKRRTGGRLIVTRHFAARRGRSVGGRLAARLVRPRIDQQVSISHFVADSIGEPSVVIPNGVLASLLGTVERDRVVVVMQRLSPEKDTATALRGWARSELADAGWRMVVYGRGAEQKSLMALAKGLGVADSVEFAGFVDDARRRLAEAGMLLATAPREPFGLSVVEAMAEGTPVVAADGGAHRETLGEDGLFFQPDDVDGCAAAICNLGADAQLRARAGMALQRRHAALFTVAAHVDQLEDVYRP